WRDRGGGQSWRRCCAHSPRPRVMKGRRKQPVEERPAGRPKLTHPIAPELAQKMIRRMPLTFAVLIFGRRPAAEEWMRRRKQRCKETGHPYDREDALNKAAKVVGMDASELNNWLRRPKHSRARY